MSEITFPVSLPLRIDWSDLDLFGHVNNVAFLKYVQSARVNYWERIGLYQSFLKTKVGPMLASTRCDFKKPLFYPGTAIVQTRVEFIKTTSFGFHHEIQNKRGDAVAEAHDVMVMFDFLKNVKVEFPAELRKIVEELEKRTF
jgi:acyl-CoA thioester hydrolase